FQAEDGIRDRTVTGVQTCALPISRPIRYQESCWRQSGPDQGGDEMTTQTAAPGKVTTWQGDPAHTHVEFAVKHLMIATVRGRFKIGRASCRERVHITALGRPEQTT